MSIPLTAYTVGGVVRGVLERPGHVRDLLELEPRLEFERATLQPIDGRLDSAPPAPSELDIDDVLIAEDDALAGPAHALLHPVRVQIGPYRVDGDLPTMPGFDPSKSLIRPSGTFASIRNALVTLCEDPETPIGRHEAVLVHRYEVELADSDFPLAFLFPGAELVVEPSLAGASAIDHA